jgi:NifU-like protein involved in Fe-S cluster formation
MCTSYGATALFEYSETLMQHVQEPLNRRVLAAANAVGTSGTPGRGRFCVVYLRIDEPRGVVDEATFQADGCGPTIASASLLTEMITGLAVTDCWQMTADDLEAALGGLPGHRKHCAVMAITALYNALQGWSPSDFPSREGVN